MAMRMLCQDDNVTHLTANVPLLMKRKDSSNVAHAVSAGDELTPWKVT